VGPDSTKSADEFLESVSAVKASHPPSLASPGARVALEGTGWEAFHDGCDLRVALWLRILLECAVPIPRPLTYVYRHLGLTRRRGASLVKELVNSGYASKHRINPARRGGGMSLLEVSEAGYRLLSDARLPCEAPENAVGGGWLHGLCSRVVTAIARSDGYTASYEVSLGLEQTLRIDIMLSDGPYNKIFSQCCFSSPEREAENAIVALGIPSVQSGRLLLVCRDKRFAHTLAEILAPDPAYQRSRERVAIRVFGDLLAQYYERPDDGLCHDDNHIQSESEECSET